MHPQTRFLFDSTSLSSKWGKTGLLARDLRIYQRQAHKPVFLPADNLKEFS
jgi:hypothetical protein